MKFAVKKDEGWGSGWRFDWGYLQITYDRYEDHWYFQVMWAKPIV